MRLNLKFYDRGGISKEWRQKIENWLQANEQDEKHNDEYRKKLKHLTNNRRSLEKDAGEN